MNEAVHGLKQNTNEAVPNCPGCSYGKSTRAPVPRKVLGRSPSVLDLVDTDVCGPFPVFSISSSHYFVSLIDDHSCYSRVYPIRAKSDLFTVFQNWLALVKKQYSRRVMFLQSDNGREYVCNDMKRLVQKHGIAQRFTAPGNP